MDIIKKEYKSILLVLGYIFVAELVYVSLAVIFLHEWYFGLIAGILVFLIGAVIGFFYVKAENNEHTKIKDSEKVEPEVKEEIAEEPEQE